MVEKDSIRQAVIDMFRVNLGLSAGESVLVLTDRPTDAQWHELSGENLHEQLINSLLAKAVAEIAQETFAQNAIDFLTFPATGRNGSEPPDDVPKAMAAHDLVVAITSYSLSHTQARKTACAAGSRVASMPGFLPEMFGVDGPMAVDYTVIQQETLQLGDLLDRADRARVTTSAGTDIAFSVAGRKAKPSTGIVREPGAWGNLPGAEAFIAPVEGTAIGRMVVEASWYDNLSEDLVLTFADGVVTEVAGGGEVGNYWREMLGFTAKQDSPLFRARRNLAELGIGTNPNARRTDLVLEAEKIKGTVHLAIGNNAGMGGEVQADLHFDFVLGQPTLLLDETMVMKDGKQVV